VEHIEYANVGIETLKAFPGNAKKHDLDEQRRSLRKGQFQPVIVRKHEDGYTILAGHGTVEAAKLEDWTHIDAKIIDCTDEEASWINLAANKIGADEGYDNELLAALLETRDGDYFGTGWQADDLDDLLAVLDQVAETPYQPSQADYAETPEQTEARSELGTGVPLASRGIRETVIILDQADHEELHSLLVKCRAALNTVDLTNGEVVLQGMRALDASLTK
jgi:ParB/Sulfiredoxin domain